jgi:hypothetical protein
MGDSINNISSYMYKNDVGEAYEGKKKHFCFVNT